MTKKRGSNLVCGKISLIHSNKRIFNCKNSVNSGEQESDEDLKPQDRNYSFESEDENDNDDDDNGSEEDSN